MSAQRQSVTLSGVACVRGDRMLFTGLDLALAAGEAALISGPNGIGKSSLLRIIAGLLRPFAGSVVRDGSLAITSEATALDPALSLGQAMAFWGAVDGTAAAAFEMARAAMGIAHLAPVPVRILSTGQKKRAVIAAVIARGADIWLLDEPANGLDVASCALLEAAIAAHRARGGIAIVASHLGLALPAAQIVTLGAAAA